MPVVVGVAGEGDVEAILETDQALHGVGRGRIHANLTVPIDRHEPEGRIDDFVHDREIQTIALGNRAPIVNAGATQRIHAHADVGAANRIHIEHIAEIVDICIEKIVAVGRAGAQGLLVRNSAHALEAALQKRISPGFNPSRDVVVRRPAVGRVVFEAAIVGRVVRGRDDYAIRKACSAPAVVGEYRVRNHRGGRVFVVLCKHDVHAVCSQHFERAGTGRHGQRMRVDAEEQRAAYILPLAVITDGLTDCQNMPFVERAFKGGATMSRGAERNPSRRHRKIGYPGVVGSNQSGHVDQHRWRGRLACQGTYSLQGASLALLIRRL